MEPLTVWRAFYSAADFWRYRHHVDEDTVSQFMISVEGQLELLGVKEAYVSHLQRPYMTKQLFTYTIRALIDTIVVEVVIKLRIGNARHAAVTLNSWEIW